jgi:nitrogen regulatory protein P-II 1
MVVIEDAILDVALAAIIKAARTKSLGDGKIFVSNIDDAIRIRTAEHGATAI